MYGKAIRFRRAFQNITDGGCDALALKILMYIKPVKVTLRVHVAEAENSAVLLCDHGMVGEEGIVPLFGVYLAACPRVSLQSGVILDGHGVDGVIKQRLDLR